MKLNRCLLKTSGWIMDITVWLGSSPEGRQQSRNIEETSRNVPVRRLMANAGFIDGQCPFCNSPKAIMYHDGYNLFRCTKCPAMGGPYQFVRDFYDFDFRESMDYLNSELESMKNET